MSYLPPKDSDIRLLLVHPDDRFLRRYMSELIGNNPFLYARFSGNNIDFNEAQETVFCDFDCIGKCEFYPDTFVIDECDRLLPTAFNELLPYLIKCNPIRILLLSRKFPSFLVENHHLYNQIEIVNTSEQVFNTNYDQLPVLEVFGFGVGRARINGHHIDLTPGELLHEIFFYILQHPTITRDEMIAQFWSHLDPKAAVINFHVTRQKLNELLGFELLALRSGYYQLNRKIVIDYDVHKFQEAVAQELSQSTRASYEGFQKAYRLHHHDFLLGTESEWVAKLRQNLRNLQCDVCVEHAKAARESEWAIGFYSQAFRYNPYREDIAYAMMAIYLANDSPCDALDVYQALERNLRYRSNIEPNRYLKQLRDQAKANCRA